MSFNLTASGTFMSTNTKKNCFHVGTVLSTQVLKGLLDCLLGFFLNMNQPAKNRSLGERFCKPISLPPPIGYTHEQACYVYGRNPAISIMSNVNKDLTVYLLD